MGPILLSIMLSCQHLGTYVRSTGGYLTKGESRELQSAEVPECGAVPAAVCHPSGPAGKAVPQMFCGVFVGRPKVPGLAA